MMQEVTVTASISAAMINSAQHKTFYACPSGRVRALIDDRLKIDTLLDNDSEVIMMP